MRLTIWTRTFLTASALAVVALLAGASRASPVALAASFTVTSVNDVVDASPGDGVCETLTQGECTLRAAIQEANSVAGSHTITLPDGTYLLTIGGIDDQAASGDLDINRSMTIVGAGASNTIVDVGGRDRVFHIGPVPAEPSVVVNLTGVTIQGGASNVGAGLYNQATIHITQSVVTKNVQSDVGGGGGIENAGTLSLDDSIISDNSAWQYGAGIGNEVGATASLSNSTVTGNANTKSTQGAGIANFGHFTVTGSTISANGGGTFGGGGIYNNGTSDWPPVVMQLTKSRVVGNTAVIGAGILNSQASLVMTDTEVSGNAAFAGGGILNSSGTLAITNSTINDNSATVDVAGGIGTAGGDAASASLTLTNATVSGNSAAVDGGGIHFGSYSDSQLRNVTIAHNTADSDGNGTGDGGGVYAVAGVQVIVQNSVTAANLDAGGQASDCQGAIQSGGYNLIGDTSGCSIGGDLSGNLLNTGASLGTLANNGGTTMTHELLAGSPAIDSGNPAAPGSGGTACEATDQRGVARPQGPRCDIGAYERQPVVSVGGIAELPDVAALPSAAASSGIRRTAYALVGVALAVVAAIGTAGWYARRKGR